MTDHDPGATAQPGIRSWHAHVYFDEASAEQAAAVCAAAGAQLPVTVGRLHRSPVGPHPRGSCQLEFAANDLRKVVDWLTWHRDGLTVFMHPNSGDELPDHRDRAIWFGASETLDLTALSR
ncbi:MAG: DOPA 4,5-dioxygenase family protein [Burkholderiaceae bacterium]